MVGRVSETPLTFEYSASARLVRGVYLPVTLTVADRTTALVIRGRLRVHLLCPGTAVGCLFRTHMGERRPCLHWDRRRQISGLSACRRDAD